jgi:hypothetical protein
MPRTLLLCSTIVAAFQLPLAAAPAPIAEVPVTSTVAALAARVGMDVARDRGRFVPEIIRRVYSPPASRQKPPDLVVGARDADTGARIVVELPLQAGSWSQAIFKRQVPSDRLLASILVDRRAALLCRGLAAADDETLAFYADHPELLAFIYEHGAAAFSAFADSLHVRAGRLVVPGGEPAVALWETVTHARVDDPDAFLRAMFIEPEARLAYLFDVLATASPEARAFGLGLWLEDAALRGRRFQALALAARSSFREWHVEELPFARPLNDLAILLLRIRVDARGEPAPPASRRFWASALDASPGLEEPGDAHPLVDAAWLLGATSGDMYTRGDKLEQFAFGQRVFGAHPDGQSDTASAVIREMTTRRMLLLGLERLGISSPEVYAAGLRQSRAVLDGGSERFWTLAQLQGALALIVRMSLNDTIGAKEAESLARSLFALPVSGGEFRGGLAEWFQQTLGPSLPRGATWEARAVAGAAGGATPGNPEVEWEGQTYRLDLAFAERRRIDEIRRRQGGPGLDLAFEVLRLGRRALQATSVDAARPVANAAQQLLAASGPALARPQVILMAPGVPVPRDGREWLARVADEIDRGVRAGDLRRISRAADSLVGLGDMLLGHVMISLVYALHLGDPEGPALLGANVALRHDFGFGRRDGEGRARGPWAQPRQDFQPEVPWHVAGSLVGLDVALGPLALRRLSMDGLAAPPRLPSIEREAFGVNVALLNPRRLGDLDRDRIVAGIARGRDRVKAIVANPASLDELVHELALDGWRARTLRGVLQNAPGSIENQFSLAELLVLGGMPPDLDAWGSSGLLSFGCVCTRFPQPGIWRILAGRRQLAMMAASTVEMNLEMTERLAALRLPAALLPSVLATAVQDFADQVDPADPNDREALVRYPRTIGRNAVDDYVAATATLDGPLVSADIADGSEP